MKVVTQAEQKKVNGDGIKKTFDNTLCYPLDLDSLVSKELERELASFGTWALIEGKGLIEKWDIVAREFTNDEITIGFCRKVNPDGNAVYIFPQTMVTLSKDEINKAKGEPVTIANFVRDRRGYNSRLSSNEYTITKWLNDGGKNERTKC